MAFYNFFTASLLVLALTWSSDASSLCEDVGIFSHPDDCTKFVVCIEDLESNLKATVSSCPDGQGFQGGRCVDVSKIPGCFSGISSFVGTIGVSPAVETEDPCRNSPVHCSSCSSLVRCTFSLDGNFSFVDPVNSTCPASTPFCNNNACSTEPSDECKVNTFQCNTAGFLPDPNNCRIGYYCSRTSTQGIIAVNSTVCNSSLVISTTTNECVPLSANSPCTRVSCPVGRVAFLNNTRDYRYFYLCNPFDTTNITARVFKCPGHYQQHTGNGRCRFQCPTSGRFPDESDLTFVRYFSCSGVGATPVLMNCPQGLVFDKISNTCDVRDLSTCIESAP